MIDLTPSERREVLAAYRRFRRLGMPRRSARFLCTRVAEALPTERQSILFPA